jgi:nitrogen regulatory protein P-II 1
MKEIKAVIRPNKLLALREALRELPGFPGMTVTHVEGCSASGRHVETHSIEEQLTEFSPKVHIQIVSSNEVAEAIFQCILQTTETGHYGDGLVWITDVEKSAFIFSPSTQ